jgi:hypothetical protein
MKIRRFNRDDRNTLKKVKHGVSMEEERVFFSAPLFVAGGCQTHQPGTTLLQHAESAITLVYCVI